VDRLAPSLGCQGNILAGDGPVIPLFSGRRTLAAANQLVPALSAWDGNTRAIGAWYRDT
jgi:hypothetical protein